MPCLSDETAAAFAEGRIAEEARPEIERHLDACAACRALVAELASLAFAPPAAGGAPGPDAGPAAATLVPGTQVGRHVIERVLGAGGGGIVYQAFDPGLGRKVALKVLRPLGSEGAAEARLARLLREAQAMARLNHPNVVTVYDVGVFEGAVVIVREYVEGESLTEWLRRAPRGWREIVDVFVAAGRGLAAAHAAGLVHQDFKPDNVLVGADGSVRVTDFGLARVPGDEPGAERAGTPAFMAPERARSGVPEPRADQYSFCVALHLALHGRLPGRGREAPAGARPAGAPDPAIPVWLDDVLGRGLNADPAGRWDSVDALVDALGRGARSGEVGAGRGPGGGRALWLGAGALAVAAVAAVVLVARGRGREAAPARAPASAAAPSRPAPGLETCDEQRPESARVDEAGPCVKVHDGPSTWSEAAAACLARGGYLAGCGSNEQCDRLAERVPAGRAVWIGLELPGPTPGRPSWSSGAPFVARFAQGRWADGHPPAGARSCVVIEAGSGAPRRWLGAGCDERRAFACEHPPWRVSLVTRHAYRVLTPPATWDEARAGCERLGGHLATITDAAEQAFIEARLWSRGVTLDVNVWLGATDRERQRRFRWITGEPFTFRAFHPSEPDNKDGAQDCLIVNGTTRRWHDRHCDMTYPALCERDPR
jgi:serine/threonine-protein kinase